jgi:hypothetical protein
MAPAKMISILDTRFWILDSRRLSLRTRRFFCPEPDRRMAGVAISEKKFRKPLILSRFIEFVGLV